MSKGWLVGGVAVSLSLLSMLHLGAAEEPAVSSRAGSTIETDFLERPWPKQWVRNLEVGRDEVRWRQRASRKGGIFAGVRFTAPLPREQVWELANDYSDIGKTTPGVTAVRFLKQDSNHQVIQIDVKVLWKTLRLNFEVEQDPPKIVRFRLRNQALGEYRGVCVFEDPSNSAGPGQPKATTVELSTWLKPNRPIPMGLLLVVERMTFLQGVKSFLETCETHPTATASEPRR